MRWAQITGSNAYHAIGRGIRARNSEPPHTQADVPLSAHDIALGKYNAPIVGLTDGTNKVRVPATIQPTQKTSNF